MELRDIVIPGSTHGSANTDLTWYTKDLMVEETSSPLSSPQLSLGPSPCDSTASSPLGDLYSLRRPSSDGSLRATPPMTLIPGSAQTVSSLPRPRVGSSSALLPVPSADRKQRYAPPRHQHKRKRSISDSLVPSGGRKERDDRDEDEIDELCIDELDGDNHVQSGPHSEHAHPHAAPGADDDESDDGFVESGEEDDDDQADLGLDSLPRVVRLQGHESGPPSPPAIHYQHGMNENPDGTAYYHCKFCQNTWPQHHFRNAQQFGAHCSNCSRKRKVKDPQDMTTTTRERNKRLRKNKRIRSSSASKASFDQTRHKLIDSDDSARDCSSQESSDQAVGREPTSKKFGSRMPGARVQSARTSVYGAAALRSEEGLDGMERLFGAMKKRETMEASRTKKSIFALLAYVKTELANLKEQEDSEGLEHATREMMQDTRTEWEARIQELRVDAASDLRAHTAALPRRLERLASAPSRNPTSHQPALGNSGGRNTLGFILNSPSEVGPLPNALSSASRAAPASVPATPPPSPLPPTRHQQRGVEVLNLALAPKPNTTVPVVTPTASSGPRSTSFVPAHSCVPPSASSLACASPLASPL